MIPRGPFQPLTFCDSVKSLYFSLILAQDFVPQRFKSPRFSAFTMTFALNISLHFLSIENVPVTRKEKKTVTDQGLLFQMLR